VSPARAHRLREAKLGASTPGDVERAIEQYSIGRS